MKAILDKAVSIKKFNSSSLLTVGEANKPIVFRCLGVETAKEIVSPMASWKPELAPFLFKKKHLFTD